MEAITEDEDFVEWRIIGRLLYMPKFIDFLTGLEFAKKY